MFKQVTIKDSRGQRIEFMVELGSSDLKTVLSKDEYRSFNRVYEKDLLGIKKRKSFRNALFYIEIIGIGMLSPLVFFGLMNFGLSGWVISRRSFFWTVLFFSVLVSYIWFAVLKHWRLRSMNTKRPCVQLLMGFKCCPACMYSLTGHDAEPDGCTVCPECGGAWKLP